MQECVISYQRAREYRDLTLSYHWSLSRRTKEPAGVKDLGIDVHGVITETPAFLSEECAKLVAAGHRVHIMTGSQDNESTRGALEGYGFFKGTHYTHLFSITDHLVNTGALVEFKEGLPYADPLRWNIAKGEYAYAIGLDCLWDDSPEYGRYMPEGCWYFTYSQEHFHNQLEQVLNGTRVRAGRK